jgi:hypothetical protein
MKIEIERSGGFAGIIKRVKIDTKTLPKDLASNVEKHLLENKVNDKPPQTMKSKMADCYYYKISGSIGNSKKQIEFSEFGADKEIKRLIDYVLNIKKNE